MKSILPLGPVATAPRCARATTAAVLAQWGMQHMIETVTLVVSELVANAVTAARQLDGKPAVQLWVGSDRRRVVVAVADGSPEPPVLQTPGADDETGRGLVLVGALAAQWDWFSAPEGKTVWAVIE